jgi:hypothetical protein
MVDEYADQSWTYTAFNPQGRLHIVCPQCRSLVLMLEDAGPDKRVEIAKLAHSRGPIAAIKRVRAVTGCDLAQAKATVLHICAAGPSCHKCGSKLEAGTLLCPQCFSVNLTWS